MRMNTVTALSTSRSPPPPRPPRAPAWPRPSTPGAADDHSPRQCQIRVLVVDDDLGCIEDLGQLLKGFAQVSFATNGEDALRLGRLQRPDLVLLDIELPGLDGFEVCARMRALPGLFDLPVIFTSQHGDAVTEAEALQLGASDYLRKPFNDVQLMARLRAQLRAAATRDADTLAPADERRRLLVIDPDIASVQQLRRVLADIGECHFALDGTQALSIVAELQPDLVLLEASLPGADRLCRTLRADPGFRAVPLLLLTHADGVGSSDEEARALALGVDDVVNKPFNAAVLRARAGRLVAAGQLRVGARAPATMAMLSYLAHEIGNPVNAIRGFAQLMQAAPLAAGQAEKLSHILEAAERLKGLLSDVGDVARLEAGQFHVESTDLELGEFLRQASRPAIAQAAQAGLVLGLPASGRPVHVRADARRLRQCLDNLLSNAFKYGSDGGRIDIGLDIGDVEVCLSVQDHGAGLSASQLAQLFEPYNRLGHDGGAIPGTGLGLTLTRQLMRAMGGRLRVHSDGVGRGCRFELLLRTCPG